jgi:hypothetical protein
MFKIYFRNKGCTRKAGMPNRLNCEPCELTPQFWEAQEGQLVCLINPIHQDKKYWKADIQLINSKKINYHRYSLADGKRMVSAWWHPVAYLDLDGSRALFTQRAGVALHDVKNSPQAEEAWEHLYAAPHIFKAAIDDFHEWFPNTNRLNE